MRQTFPGSVRSVGNREFKFTAVTSLGRDGHILEPSGVDLSEYRKVPVVLWQHQAASPVARCTSIGMVDCEVRGTAEFAPAGTSAAVDEAFGYVKSGVVGAVSIGFDLVDAEPSIQKRDPRRAAHQAQHAVGNFAGFNSCGRRRADYREGLPERPHVEADNSRRRGNFENAAASPRPAGCIGK
jgi:hypothetical protein